MIPNRYPRMALGVTHDCCGLREYGHGKSSGTHDISFYCDDIAQTVDELQARGVEFTDGVVDAGFGLVTHFKMPGDVRVQLYQPHYSKTLRS